jgi:hypothetical protein
MLVDKTISVYNFGASLKILKIWRIFTIIIMFLISKGNMAIIIY